MSASLTERFDELTEILRRTQPYWREFAFYRRRLTWMDRHPDLVNMLLQLAPERVEQLAGADLQLGELMAPHLPFVSQLHSLATLPLLPGQPAPTVPARFYAGMPGRKWQQVLAFAERVTGSSPVLEWCAGKSYLGFYLQYCCKCTVTALEWNAMLVNEANARAVREGATVHSCQVDVLSAAAEQYLQAQNQVVALHACGELHERLLQLSVKYRPAQVHMAPCCYHKRSPEIYTGMSARGRAARLNFSRQELHTAVMETVTSGATVQRQRRRLQMMRLGFEELRRESGGGAEYLPVPSLPASWAKANFADFCRHCAELKGLSLPDQVDWPRFQQRGEQRFHEVAALDLVRFLFRRPIEVWLALDRALLLEEHGYRVQLGIFCPGQITPRNLLIQAWRLGP